VALKTYDVRSRLQTESSPRLSTFVSGMGRQHLPSICGPTGANYAGAGYAYDGLSRKITVTEADTSVTSYKDQGDSTSHTYQTLEIDPVQVNQLNYADAAGRLKEVDENCTSCFSGTYGIAGQATYHTTYGYDVLDDLMTVTQASESRSFTYDSLKRLVQAVNPESGTVKYSYDASNNLSTRKDADGSVLTFTAYDGMNRVTGKSYTLGSTSACNCAGVQPTPTVAYAYINVASQEPRNCPNLLTARRPARPRIRYPTGTTMRWSLSRSPSPPDACNPRNTTPEAA
jgi:YD repeat-containing protein